MKLILLPGLDGTGKLFQPLIDRLPPAWDIQVVCYPLTGKQDYATLTAYVYTQLPRTEPFCLLAESFSGPIAYGIASNPLQNLQTVIFVATFLSNPRPLLLRWRAWLPLHWKMPAWFVRSFLLGRHAETALIVDFWTAVFANPTPTLLARLTAIATASAPDAVITTPCLYLQASADWLIPNHAVHQFRLYCKELKVHQISGTHFLLQSSPAAAAQIIQDELGWQFLVASR